MVGLASATSQSLQGRVRRYLDQAYNHAMAGPAFESPARALFSYCALLISALAHPDENPPSGRCFLDLAIETPQRAVRLTSLPDCDLEYLELDQRPPPLLERLKGSTGKGQPGIEHVALVDQQLGIAKSVSLQVMLGHPRPLRASAEIVKEELTRVWNRLIAAEEASRSVSAALEAWMASSSAQWPERLEPDSPFDRQRDRVIERLRDLLDHLEITFTGSNLEGEVTAGPSVYFVRKTRYYAARGPEPRLIVCRRIGTDLFERYLLGYFLSWRQTKELADLKRQRKDDLLEALKQSAARERAEACSEQSAEGHQLWCDEKLQALSALIECLGGASNDHEERRDLLRALESPIGDVPPPLREQKFRSVADSMFITSVPEIVWDVDQDRRFGDFAETAPPVVTTIERWLWGRRVATNTTSDEDGLTAPVADETPPEDGTSSPSTPTALLFVPLPAGRDPLFGAYMPIAYASPLSSEDAMDRLAQLGHRAVDAERATVQFFLDVYGILLVEAFAERYVRYLAERATEAGALDAETLEADLLEETNEAFRTVSLVMDLPLVMLRRPETGDEPTFFRAFQESALVSGVRHNQILDGVSNHHVSEHSSPQATEINEARRLDWVAAAFAEDAPNELTEYIRDRFQRLVGLYLENELPYQMMALQTQEEAASERTIHTLKHELKGLINYAHGATEGLETAAKRLPFAHQALGFVLERLDDVGDDGRPRISGDPRGQCDAQRLITEFIRQVYPHPSTLDGIPLHYTDRFIPRDRSSWLVPFHPAYFTALYRNLTGNAENALRKATAQREPETGSARWRRELRMFLRAHGTLSDRFPDGRHPQPTILAIIRQGSGYLYFEVLDNAPAFQARFDYPRQPTEDGLGLKVCRDIERTLQDAGCGCWFEQVHALSDDEAQELQAIPELADLAIQGGGKWSITRFVIEG